jgi:hypothetical protein
MADGRKLAEYINEMRLRGVRGWRNMPSTLKIVDFPSNTCLSSSGYGELLYGNRMVKSVAGSP